MIRQLILSGILSIATQNALATTCTQPGDWVPQLCDLKVAPETRCALIPDNMVARTACAPQTVGCAEIGGCFGFVPPSHWWPINDGGETRRCVCGCFAEDTEFLAESGPVTGHELIQEATRTQASQSTSGVRLYALLDEGGRSFGAFDINGIVHGSEKKPVYFVRTRLGRRVTLSDQHPVLMVTENGAFAAVKVVSQVSKGEHVLTDDGRVDTVESIETQYYPGKMVNFNVMSKDPLHHFVVGGGLVLGDNAWQQRLASAESRILQRADLLRALQKEGDHL